MEADEQFKTDIRRVASDMTFDCLVFDIAKAHLPVIHQNSKKAKKEWNDKQKLDVYHLSMIVWGNASGKNL